jgi:hypothetical protein
MQSPHVRIVLRPIGTPITVGMAGLAIASLVQSGLDLRWIAPTEGRDVGFILISVPFLMQGLASVLSYLARDSAAGALLGILSTTWLGYGLIHLTAAPGSTSGALGLLLLASGGTLLFSGLAVTVLKPLIGLIFVVEAMRWAVAGIYQLSHVHSWQPAAGIIGCVVTGLAGYSVVAFELEGELHRPLLPTLRRASGRTAVEAGLEAQTRGVVNEAGVRQTS